MQQIFDIASARKQRQKSKIKLGIGLQGGAVYGSYTRGVLKTLFQSPAFAPENLEIKAITGTSAGAVVGSLVTSGIEAGGYDEAILRMDQFWHDVGASAPPSFYNPYYPNLSPWEKSLAHFVPKGLVIKELRKKIDKHIPDWDAIRNGSIELYTNAAELIETGELKHVVFTPEEASPDTITASGALPELGAHKIGGRVFLDGALLRNPCTDHVLQSGITDLLIVTLQKTPEEPIRSIHQDAFQDAASSPGAKLITEEFHHHIAHIHEQYPHINLHTISLDVHPNWDDSSRMNTSPRWIKELEQYGIEDAEDFLSEHASALGKRSSYTIPYSEADYPLVAAE